MKAQIVIDPVEQQTKNNAIKLLLWLGIISMLMFWGGLTSAYIVNASSNVWQTFEVPTQFTYSTITIIISSITLYVSSYYVKRNNNKFVVLGLTSTLLLGLAFTYFQYQGWIALYQNEVVFSGKNSHASGSFFILFIFAHWFHLLGGLIALLFTLFKAKKQKYSSANYNGLSLCAIYWHFLDILWIYLFLFLVYIS